MTIILEWHGPFDGSKLVKVAPPDAFYVIKGKEPYKRKALVHFKGFCKTPSEAIRKVRNVTRERRYYFCKLAGPPPENVGNILKMLNSLLNSGPIDPAEREPFPTVPVTLIMEFYKRNGEPRFIIPSFISKPARNVWHWDTRRWHTGKI